MATVSLGQLPGPAVLLGGRDTEASLEEACLTHGPEDTAIMEQREGWVLGAAWSAMPADSRDRNSMLGFLSFPPFTQFNSQTVRDW